MLRTGRNFKIGYPTIISWVSKMFEKTTLQVEKDLLNRFQGAVVRRFGKLKGAQSEALAEAMRLWLSYTGSSKCVRLFGGDMDRVVELGKVPAIVVGCLKRRVFSKSDVSIVPLFFRFTFEDFNFLRSQLESMLNGLVAKEDGEGDEKVVVWRLNERELFKMYFEEKLISFGVRLEEPEFREFKRVHK